MHEREGGRDQPLGRAGAVQAIGVQGHDQRARVVVDAIAALADRHAEAGMLDDAGVVGHAQQMVEAQLRQAARPRRHQAVNPPRRTQALFRQAQVLRADARPGECARVLVALPPDPGELRGRGQQRDDPRAQGGAVGEREQKAAAVREQLLGVPVGRRHHRRARAHGVGERAARDLRFVEVRADEDVGRLQVAAQLLGGDVLIAKHDVIANAERLRLAFERGPIGLAVLADDRRVRRARRRSRPDPGRPRPPPGARGSRSRYPCSGPGAQTSAACGGRRCQTCP